MNGWKVTARLIKMVQLSRSRKERVPAWSFLLYYFPPFLLSVFFPSFVLSLEDDTFPRVALSPLSSFVFVLVFCTCTALHLCTSCKYVLSTPLSLKLEGECFFPLSSRFHVTQGGKELGETKIGKSSLCGLTEGRSDEER